MTMNNIKYYAFILSIGFFTILLHACAEYKVVSIQTLNPSKVIIPQNFYKPKISVSYYKGISGDMESFAKASADSIAGDEAANALRYLLQDSPWFENFSIPISYYERKDESPYILPFSWEKVEAICAPDTADLLISLEYISISPSINTYSFSENYIKYYHGALTVKSYAYWRIYNLQTQKVFGELLIRDTLVWEKDDFDPVIIGKQLPGIFQSASHMGYLIAEEYAKHIAPTWADEQRMFYSIGSKEMRQGAVFASNNQWLDAAKNWQLVYNNKNTSPELAGKAAFNLALANEMHGNFEASIEWLNKSKELFISPWQSVYFDVIVDRMAKLQKLKSEDK
jgi:hypothetical protein